MVQVKRIYVGDDLIKPAWSLADRHNAVQLQLVHERLKYTQRFGEVCCILINCLNHFAITEEFDAFLAAGIQVAGNEIRMRQFFVKIFQFEPIEPAICATVDSYSYWC